MNQESTSHTAHCKFVCFETYFIIGIMHDQQATLVIAAACLWICICFFSVKWFTLLQTTCRPLKYKVKSNKGIKTKNE